MVFHENKLHLTFSLYSQDTLRLIGNFFLHYRKVNGTIGKRYSELLGLVVPLHAAKVFGKYQSDREADKEKRSRSTFDEKPERIFRHFSSWSYIVNSGICW